MLCHYIIDLHMKSVSLHVLGFVKEIFEFLLVSGAERTLCQCTVAACGSHPLHCRLGPGLDVGPGTHVLVLLLHPEQLSVAVHISHLTQRQLKVARI